MIDAHAKSLKSRFSAAAETYHVLSIPQAVVAERLAQLIPNEADGSRILEIGCGTGLLTTQILKRFPDAHVDAIDLSAIMIAQARARFASNPRIRWFAIDMTAFKPRHTYPLVVSSSSLHWLADLQGGVRHISDLVEPGGHMVFSVMLKGTLGELHALRKQIAPHKPPLRGMPRADEVMTAVAGTGFRILDSSVEDYKASYRSADAFLRTLHDQGVTGGAFSQSTLPLNRRELQALTDAYDHAYSSDAGHVYATYRVLFVIGVKPMGK
jgi:malonyl-CoA O-methyltransferase